MKTAILTLLLLCPTVALSQSPYAGQETREIKSFSSDEVKQYLSGAGMGYAKAAELNGYPGPMHVIELADKLTLTADQRNAAQRLMDAHKVEARVIGAKLVGAERELERLFSAGKTEQAALSAQVKKVAVLEGEYRLSHLETHRRMREILTSTQIQRYIELRGYATTDEHSDAAHHNMHH